MRLSRFTSVVVGVLLCAEGAAAQVPFVETVVDAASPTNPWMKAIGDIDGDGLKDLVVSGQAGPVVWYESPGWTKHVIATKITGAPASTDITVEDLDGDGDSDVILANGLWYEHPGPLGDPALDVWVSRSYSNDPGHDVHAVDLDGDLDLDLVVRDQVAMGDRILIFRQETPSLFTRVEILNLPEGEGLTVSDIDDDGDWDIVLGDRWLENDGDPIAGAWTEHLFRGVEAVKQEWVVEAGDLNGDGLQDVVVAPAEYQGGVGNIYWYQGPADPRVDLWTEHMILAGVETTHHSLQLADYDGDGDLDVMTGSTHVGTNPDDVFVLLNSGDGLAWTQHSISLDGTHNAQAGDVDGDGDIDVFGANWSTSGSEDGAAVKLWLNDGFVAPILSLDQWETHLIDDNMPGLGLFVEPGDINGDGLVDLVAGGWWYENPGDLGGVWPRNAIGAPFLNQALVLDLDGDGDIDVLGTDSAYLGGDLYWGRNDGDGTFTVIFLGSSGAGNNNFIQGRAVGPFVPGPLQIALNWHGKEGGGGDPPGVQIVTLPAGPAGNPSTDPWDLSPVIVISPEVQHGEGIASADLDDDGDLDLMLGTYWMRNEGGTWTFFETHPALTLGHPDRVRLADIDSDGDLDVVIGFHMFAGLATEVIWLEHPVDPTSTWALRTIMSNNEAGGFSLDVADMDNDGDIDVVLGEHLGPTRLLLFENTGDGVTWTQHLIDPGGLGVDHHDGSRIVDMDKDGDFDIISVGFINKKVWVFENKAIDGAAGPDSESPTTPQNLVAVARSANRVDLSWDASTDNVFVEGYDIFREGLLLDNTSQTTFSDIGLLPLTAYSYAIVARDLIGNTSASSSSAEVTTLDVAPLPPSLIAHWDLDEGTGTNAFDSAGSHHGTLLDGPTWIPGQIGNALHFDGVNDYVDVGSFDVSGSAITIAAWFKSENLSSCSSRYKDCRIISKSASTASKDHYWMLSTIENKGAKLRFRLKTGASTTTLIATAGTLSNNVWTHAAAVYDGSTMTLYKDGVVVGSTSKTGELATNPSVKINIGRNPDGYGEWDGALDDIRIYARALMAQEIADLMNPVPAVCGNNVIEDGEVCDSDQQACAVTGYAGTQSCNPQCDAFEFCTTNEFCGDGLLNGPEQCDDGNLLDGDGCSSTCTVEVPPAVCGNNVIEDDEVCDSDLQACTVTGYAGTQSCNPQCDAYEACATNEFCGDGLVNGPEQCDDGNLLGGDGCSSFCLEESSDLVAHWAFDEESGTAASDSAGNHDGTLVSGPTWTPGQVGNALQFDGANDYVDVGSFDVSGSAITIAAWFKSENLSSCSSRYKDCRIISKSSSSLSKDHYWMLSTIENKGAKLRFRLKTGAITTTLIATAGSLSNNVWTHAAAVYDGSTMTLYKDGVVVGSTSKTGELATNPSVKINIGRNPDGYGEWDGTIDDVRIYDRALTAQEIADLM